MCDLARKMETRVQAMLSGKLRRCFQGICFNFRRGQLLTATLCLIVLSLFTTMFNYPRYPSNVPSDKQKTLHLPTETEIKYTGGTEWQLYYKNPGKFAITSSYAFVDDRKSIGSKPVIRFWVISYGIKSLFCQFWYTDSDTPVVAKARLQRRVNWKVAPQTGDEYIFLMTGHNYTKSKGAKKIEYSGYLASCPITSSADLKTSIPRYASIVESHKSQPSTKIEIITPQFHDKPIHEFGHCIQSTFGNPYGNGSLSVERFVEWVEIGRMFGITEFLFYNASLDYTDNMNKALDYYIKEGLIKVVQTPNPFPNIGAKRYGTAHDERNIPRDLGWMHCLYHNMYRYKYIVIYDLDEMIVPHRHNNYSQMIQDLEKIAYMEKIKANNKTVTNLETVTFDMTNPRFSYLFNNAYFFRDFYPVDYTQPPHLTLLKHQTRTTSSSFRSKHITNPRTCTMLYNHKCLTFTKEKLNFKVDENIGINHHYRNSVRGEYSRNFTGHFPANKTDRSLLRFTTDIQGRVEPIFEHLKSIH